MTEVSGYSAKVEHTAEERREHNVALREARDKQALGSLAYIRDNARDGYYAARPNDGAVVGYLESKGWVSRFIRRNPSGHISSAAKDRIEVRVSQAGREALEAAGL